MRKILVLFCLFLPLLAWSQGDIFNVKDYGATGIKTELATSAIQAAIDACDAAGGGQVYLPPGEYRAGTLVLKSNLTLYLEAGATLFASHDTADYPADITDAYGNPVLLYARESHHISIRGKGRVHGEAVREYRDLEGVDRYIPEITENARQAGVEMKMYYKVPPITGLLYFKACTYLSFEDVSFLESTFWTLHLDSCERVQMRGLYVYSSLESGVNADGIDLTCCREVTISDCIITTGDDAICLKTHKKAPCEYITVTNCVLSSSSTALKLGTGSYGDFRHILFNNCSIRNSNRGLSIVVYDGCTVEDVIFSNITIECRRRHFNWWGDADPIWVVVTKRRESSAVGYMKNILFENIIAHGRGTSRIESREGRRLENITLRNVQFFMEHEDYLDKRANHGLYVHDITGLHLEDVAVHWSADSTEPKWGNAIRVEDADKVTIQGFEGRQGLLEGDHAAIHLHSVRDAVVEGLLPDKGSGVLLRVSGESSDQILIRDADPWNRSTKVLEVMPEVPGDHDIQYLERP